MKLGILTDFYNHYQLYEKSCLELNVDYVIIDFLSNHWLQNIKNNLDCDGFLVRPTHDFQEHRDVYMERLYFLNKVLNQKIYPGYEELWLYENKRNMYTWLSIHDFPHAQTNVFLNKQDAIRYIKNCTYPIVMKSNTGAGATGVEVIKTRRRAIKRLNNVFGRIHPLFALGHPQHRKKFKINLPVFGMAEKHILLVQKYKEIKWEWRIIKIGHSFFGHQKLLKNNIASGSGMVGWVEPPRYLLDLTQNICQKGNFYSMAVDIFETTSGEYCINELQSLFGSYLDSQMLINDIPGRFKYENGNYIFEKGYFNRLGSYLLRVEHFINILKAS